jgi:hypothetical protein
VLQPDRQVADELLGVTGVTVGVSVVVSVAWASRIAWSWAAAGVASATRRTTVLREGFMAGFSAIALTLKIAMQNVRSRLSVSVLLHCKKAFTLLSQ